ncbi:MAG: SMC-Scp complex subunit ScpB [Patescibacteria group bacterium]|nr:SMC-Scp complex subunit ScpB [Patescibacteria group bacterium]
MSFDPQSSLGKVEAMLFIYGEPIEMKKLAKIVGLKEADLESAIAAYETELARDERGLTLVRDKSKVQLVTKPAFAKMLEDITKQEFSESLTPAALETLSIISYAGPISRADIEFIRGVNSSFIVRTLLMRGLVDRETDPKRSNTYLYRTSFELLRHLGLQKNADLPDYAKYKELVAHMHEELKEKESAQQNPILPPADATEVAEVPAESPAAEPQQQSFPNDEADQS